MLPSRTRFPATRRAASPTPPLKKEEENTERPFLAAAGGPALHHTPGFRFSFDGAAFWFSSDIDGLLQSYAFPIVLAGPRNAAMAGSASRRARLPGIGYPASTATSPTSFVRVRIPWLDKRFAFPRPSANDHDDQRRSRSSKSATRVHLSVFRAVSTATGAL
jgi:hypothetical protein